MMEESVMPTAQNDVVNLDEGGDVQDQKKQLAEEFNVQRAKMKELFLQKEEEMRRITDEKEQLDSVVLGLRSQLDELNTLSQNQKHEIESMQMLIHETMEQSSSVCAEEVRKLQARNAELEQQIATLAKQQASQDSSLAPAALVQTVTRSIARKLGADADDDAKKVQEETELVKPLEEEIKALKEKLRDTDTKLQATLSNKAAKSEGKELEIACHMCANYEQQLVAEQGKSEDTIARARNAERALKIATEELESTRSLHEESLRTWRSERESGTAELEALKGIVIRTEQTVHQHTENAEKDRQQALLRVTDLTVDRQMLQEKLNMLEKDNAMLVGKYTKKASDLQSEDINIPDNFEELQEYVLKLREELIVVTLGRESALHDEEQLRLQLVQRGDDHRALAQRHDDLLQQHRLLKQQLQTLETEREQMNDLGDKLRSSNARLEELLNDKKRLQNEVMELRNRVSSLQQELDNSEKVQQDFVRLSQSLQVELESIREATTEVRWQNEDDVTECPVCRTHLPNTKKKVHCRHCGRIFCSTCVRHSVASGPRGVPARVCGVCRTLLQPDTAPYFSTDAPD